MLHGRLSRVQKQLRMQEGLLTKSGRSVIPPSLRKLIVAEYHSIAHFGVEKVYALLKARCQICMLIFAPIFLHVKLANVRNVTLLHLKLH